MSVVAAQALGGSEPILSICSGSTNVGIIEAQLCLADKK